MRALIPRYLCFGVVQKIWIVSNLSRYCRPRGKRFAGQYGGPVQAEKEFVEAEGRAEAIEDARSHAQAKNGQAQGGEAGFPRMEGDGRRQKVQGIAKETRPAPIQNVEVASIPEPALR